jgi:hypothetical protein
MKINLNVGQRLSIAQFLPKESNLSEQLIGKSILDKSMVTKTERTGLRNDPLYQDRIDPDCDFDVEIDFSKEEFELLYSNFLQMDKDKKINSTNVSLALKIRESKPVEKK